MISAPGRRAQPLIMASRRLLVRGDARGMAVVLSLISLLALSAMVIAFSALSSSEPTIANNQLRVAAARAVAEAGLERAIWALNPGTEAGRAGYDPEAGPLSGTLAAPYDGSTSISLSLNGVQYGAFRITLAPWADPATGAIDPWRVTVDAVGWTPSDPAASPGDTRSRARQRISATLMRLRNVARDARCALCARGSLEVQGSAVVDARPADGDLACGPVAQRSRPGAFAAGAANAMAGGVVYGSIQPATAQAQANRVSATLADVGGPYDIVRPAVPDDPAFRDAFDAFAFRAHDFALLRAMARANGAYYRGVVTFEAGHRLPSGIVFVDTVDGVDVGDFTPAADLARVVIRGDAGSDPGNAFNGWLIVNGSLSIAGDIQINGLVYAGGDIDYAPTGGGRVEGQLISGNRHSTAGTRVHSRATAGPAHVRANCAYVKNGGAGTGVVGRPWSLVAGSYRERGE